MVRFCSCDLASPPLGDPSATPNCIVTEINILISVFRFENLISMNEQVIKSIKSGKVQAKPYVFQKL
jgi:hypothetical protein